MGATPKSYLLFRRPKPEHGSSIGPTGVWKLLGGPNRRRISCRTRCWGSRGRQAPILGVKGPSTKFLFFYFLIQSTFGASTFKERVYPLFQSLGSKPSCVQKESFGWVNYTWAKPRYGRKSVRFRFPDLPPGRIFMKRT